MFVLFKIVNNLDFESDTPVTPKKIKMNKTYTIAAKIYELEWNLI